MTHLLSKTGIQVSFIMSSVFLMLLSLLNLQLPLTVQLMLFILLGSTLGLGHGALDYDLAKHLRLAGTSRMTLLFLAGYTAVAALTFLLWWFSPLVGFLMFIFLTIQHFGSDWTSDHLDLNFLWISQAVFGVAFFALPSFFHGSDLIALFGLLLAENQANMLVTLFNEVALICIFFIGFRSIVLLYKKDFLNALMVLTYLFAGLILPPVLFLLCYFCFFHSPMHLYDLSKFLKVVRMRNLLKRIAPVFFATLFILIALWIIKIDLTRIEHSLFANLILLTAALTTPHMILIAYKNHKQQ